MKYGTIFGENSTDIDPVSILQKTIVRIMAGFWSRSSCRRLFKTLDILPVSCQYIFSLTMFVADNLENFQTNLSIHGMNTKNTTQFQGPIVNLSCFQKGDSYAGIKIFNSLPSSPSKFRNDRIHFKVALRRYLIAHSFYWLAEFLTYRKDTFMTINYNL